MLLYRTTDKTQAFAQTLQKSSEEKAIERLYRARNACNAQNTALSIAPEQGDSAGRRHCMTHMSIHLNPDTSHY